MIINTKRFWTWWTTELRSWMIERFNSVLSRIPQELSDLAKESTLEKNTKDIINKIETTQPDLSRVAKERTLTQGILDITQTIGEECSEADIYAMWDDDDDVFKLNISKLNINKLG